MRWKQPAIISTHCDVVLRNAASRPSTAGAPGGGAGPDSQTLEQFRRDRSSRAVVRKASPTACGSRRTSPAQFGWSRPAPVRRPLPGTDREATPVPCATRSSSCSGWLASRAAPATSPNSRPALPLMLWTPRKSESRLSLRRGIRLPAPARPFRFAPGALRTPPRTVSNASAGTEPSRATAAA